MFNFFKKKKEEPKEDVLIDDDKTHNVASSKYKVIIWDKLAGARRFIREFEAERFIDKEDGVVYLVNPKIKFFEIFPQSILDFKNYTSEQVEKRILEIETKLKDELNKDTEKVNEKDLEFELMKLKAKQRSFKFSPNSSYIDLGKGGKPTFNFLREGSTLHPFRSDCDTKTIYTPSDNKKKSAIIALRNKQQKYSKFNKAVTGIAIFMLIAGFLFFCGGGFMLYKAFSKYDASSIAQYERLSLAVANNCANLTLNNALKVNEIYNDIKGNLTNRNAVIEGLVPDFEKMRQTK